MGNFFARLIPKNIAGLLGLIEPLISAVRELLMVVSRIIAVFLPGVGEAMIDKTGGIFDGAIKGWQVAKNFLLKAGD